MPLAIAAAAVLIVAAIVVFMMQRGKGAATVTPISAAPDPCATSLPITRRSDERVEQSGWRQSDLYRRSHHQYRKQDGFWSARRRCFSERANEVAQNETQPLKWIRTRDPYVDLEPVSAAPLKPGEGRNFRLIFDTVTPDWNGAYPEIRIVHVDAK